MIMSSGLASGELPESTQDVMIEATRSYYQHFTAAAAAAAKKS